MRSIRRVLALTLAAAAIALSTPVASATSDYLPIHLVKDCTAWNGETPSLCTIATTDFAALPVGSKVWYLGPVLSDNLFLGSNIRLEAVNGDTATGFCIFQPRTSRGMCSFWEGTGTLAGFHAVFDVSIDDGKLWHLDGLYHMSPQAAVEAPGPSPREGHHQW
jgi:hypothetical protein